MIVSCHRGCGKRFDDEFRSTVCPHDTFAANDGKNNFAHHPESHLSGGEANWHPEISPDRAVDDGIPGWLALIIIGGFLGVAAGFVYAIVVGR